MSRHARIEEIEDSDPEEVDISNLDAPDLPIAGSTFQPGRHIVPPTPSSSVPRRTPPSPSTGGGGGGGVGNPSLLSDPASLLLQPSAAAAVVGDYKSFQCLYPVYFDAARTRAQGRRVAGSKAVRNPLAREIADACGALGIQTVFEPGKTHPKDWCNPGRVRVKLDGTGKNSSSTPLLLSSPLIPPPRSGVNAVGGDGAMSLTPRDVSG